MKNLNSNLNPSTKDCAASAAATTVALYSFETPGLKLDSGSLLDGFAEGYIWNVMYKNGVLKYLSEKQLVEFLEAYYEEPIELLGIDNSWKDHVWLPDSDSWWEGRASLIERVWDADQEMDYVSGRQPIVEHYLKFKREVKRAKAPVVPTKVAEFMQFVKSYLHDHMLLWDSTPFYEGIYTYPNGVQEYKVKLMHNGGYYSYVNEAVQAYNAKYGEEASVGDAHHLYLPI